MSLYIHIPFCCHICAYCDFAKVFYNEKWADDYLVQLEKEYNDKKTDEKHQTVYIGGGSPSALSLKQLTKLFEIIKESLQTSKESTIEVNPEDLTLEKAKLFKQNNIHRVSLGVQTFQDHLLQNLGRKHTLNDIKQALAYLKEAKIERISLDFIYGLPNQTMDDLKADLTILKTLEEVKHVSFYTLILEEHTKFYNDGVKLKDDDWLIDAQKVLIEELEKQGFHRYEVSNFAKNNEESQHNLVYWKQNNYVGIGCGASGFENHTRYDNTRSLTEYLKGNINPQLTPLTLEDEMFEFVMLGLRLTQGISLEEFKHRFNKDLLHQFNFKRFIQMNLLTLHEDTLKTTPLGMDVLDEILIEI